MVLEKRQLSLEDIEAQTALELPDREMMLVTVVLTNLIDDITIPITVQNNNVAVQVCAAVFALNSTFPVPTLSCEILER